MFLKLILLCSGNTHALGCSFNGPLEAKSAESLDVDLSSSDPFGNAKNRDSTRRQNSWSHPLARENRTHDFDASVDSQASLGLSLNCQRTLSDSQNSGLNIDGATSDDDNSTYSPAKPHWFYLNSKERWIPFSFKDNRALERAYKKFTTRDSSEEYAVVATDGNRYDVNFIEMTRKACYWPEDPSIVKRCTWFYGAQGNTNMTPFNEKVSELLEENYKEALLQQKWKHYVALPDGDSVVFHSPHVMVHYRHSHDPIDWTGENAKNRPKIVHRGIHNVEHLIEEGETGIIDHVIFVVHGIGDTADLQGRSIYEAVDLLRSIGLELMTSHQFVEEGDAVGRVEFIPIEWHDKLRISKSGINERIQAITLPSLKLLRPMYNSTFVDAFLYVSPVFCQQICRSVVEDMNELYKLFQSRNPQFKGNVSVCGHSLGGLILFDVLAGQNQDAGKNGENTAGSCTLLESEANINYHLEKYGSQDGAVPIYIFLKQLGLLEWLPVCEDEHIMDSNTLRMCSEDDMKDIGIPLGPRKKIIKHFKLLRSRPPGQEKRKNSSNSSSRKVSIVIAQPPLLENANGDTSFEDDIAVILPRLGHIQGPSSIDVLYEECFSGTGQPLVKYEQLDFSPSHLFAMGSPIGVFLTTRGVHRVAKDFRLPTCPAFFNIVHPNDPMAVRVEPFLDLEIKEAPKLIPHYKGRKRFHLEIRDCLLRVSENLRRGVIDVMRNAFSSMNQFGSAHRPSGTPEEESDGDLDADATDKYQTDGRFERFGRYGNLNGGRRIDFALQETPLESLSEYLSAINGHFVYWSSRDVVLLMLTEIYRPRCPGAYRSNRLPRYLPFSRRDEL